MIDIPEDLHKSIGTMVSYYATSESIKHLGLIDNRVTTYCWAWKRSKENTSTGRSGIYFGHFQAGCTDPLIREIDRWFTEMSMSTGYSQS
jgi:hypothetical protein